MLYKYAYELNAVIIIIFPALIKETLPLILYFIILRK